MTSRLLPQLDGMMGQQQGAMSPGEAEKKVGFGCFGGVGDYWLTV